MPKPPISPHVGEMSAQPTEGGASRDLAVRPLPLAWRGQGRDTLATAGKVAREAELRTSKRPTLVAKGAWKGADTSEPTRAFFGCLTEGDTMHLREGKESRKGITSTDRLAAKRLNQSNLLLLFTPCTRMHSLQALQSCKPQPIGINIFCSDSTTIKRRPTCRTK